MEQKFVNKIKTKDGIEYDMRDARVEALEAEVSGKASHEEAAEAKSYIAGNSLIIPEQLPPEPIITIDGVKYYHKQEFNLEFKDSPTYYDLLSGEVIATPTMGDERIALLAMYPVVIQLYTNVPGQGTMYNLVGDNKNYTSRAFEITTTTPDHDSSHILLPRCSAYYGFLSEDGKTFISYYNLKVEAPEYIDSVKQGNAVIPLKDLSAGSKLYRHVIQAIGPTADVISKRSEPYTSFSQIAMDGRNIVVNGSPTWTDDGFIIYYICYNGLGCCSYKDGALAFDDLITTFTSDTVTEL